jgi:hypothetical protein
MEVSSTVGPRHFRSKSEIRDLLVQQQQSGLSVKSFCGERSISEGTFHNWKKRYSGEPGMINSDAFTSIQPDRLPVGLFAEVNGIKLYQPVSAGYLKELVS